MSIGTRTQQRHGWFAVAARPRQAVYSPQAVSLAAMRCLLDDSLGVSQAHHSGMCREREL